MTLRRAAPRAALAALFVLAAASCSDEAVPLGPSFAPGGGSGDVAVNSTDPQDAPQDTTLDVRVLGSGFDRGSVAEWAVDGVPIGKVRTNSTRYVSSKELVANITIALDADTVLYDVLVTTSRGKKGIGTELFRVRPKGPKPPPPPPDPAIAFKVTGTVDRLYVMNADGSHQAVIVEGQRFSAFLAQPSWSPDGKSVVFTGRPKGQPDGMWILDVVVVNGTPTGQNLRRILDRGAGPAWSPVGDEIVFADCAGACSLSVIPATGGSPVALYTLAGGRDVNMPDWSPDGGRIAFTENDQFGPPALVVLDRASGQVETIVPSGGFSTLRFPAWSRAGDRIAFSGSHADGNPEAVFVVPASAPGSPVQVVTGLAPTWSPTDGKLLFTGATPGLFTYEIASGVVAKIAASGVMADWRRF